MVVSLFSMFPNPPCYLLFKWNLIESLSFVHSPIWLVLLLQDMSRFTLTDCFYACSCACLWNISTCIHLDLHFEASGQNSVLFSTRWGRKESQQPACAGGKTSYAYNIHSWIRSKRVWIINELHSLIALFICTCYIELAYDSLKELCKSDCKPTQ